MHSETPTRSEISVYPNHNSTLNSAPNPTFYAHLPSRLQTTECVNLCREPSWPIQVKIGDFRVSKFTEGSALQTQLGTRLYMAPEILDGTRVGVDSHCDLCMISGLCITKNHHQASMAGTYRKLNSTLLFKYCEGGAFPMDALNTAKALWDLQLFIQQLMGADPSARMLAKQALADDSITSEHSMPEPSATHDSYSPTHGRRLSFSNQDAPSTERVYEYAASVISFTRALWFKKTVGDMGRRWSNLNKGLIPKRVKNKYGDEHMIPEESVISEQCRRSFDTGI
ncbi:hypothetical protein DFP73DRAFT_523299 [Morchella snyderi]|nr:hypothetical protein DFP73DRAFT_523299 [Morchella snyderi]